MSSTFQKGDQLSSVRVASGQPISARKIQAVIDTVRVIGSQKTVLGRRTTPGASSAVVYPCLQAVAAGGLNVFFPNGAISINGLLYQVAGPDTLNGNSGRYLTATDEADTCFFIDVTSSRFGESNSANLFLGTITISKAAAFPDEPISPSLRPTFKSFPLCKVTAAGGEITEIDRSYFLCMSQQAHAYFQ